MTEEGPQPELGEDVDDRWREEGPAAAGPIPGLSSSGERARPRAAGTAHLAAEGLLPPGVAPPSGPGPAWGPRAGGTAPLPGSGPLQRGGTAPLPGSGPLPKGGTGALPGSGPLGLGWGPSGGTGALALEAEPEVLVPGVGKMRASDAQRLQALRAALEAEDAPPPPAWKPWKIAYLPPTLMMVVGLLALAFLLVERLAVSPWLCVLGHGLITALTGLTWRPFGRLVAWRNFGVALALPGVGPAIAWVTYMSERNDKNTLTDSYREFVAFTPTWSAMRAVRDAEAALRSELSVRPWVEALRVGDLPVKQVAAENLAKTHDGVALLRQALTDPDGEVRLFASLALVKAEEAQVEAMAQAREALKQAKQSGEGLAAAQLRLSQTLADHAASGLPAEEDVAVLWGEALALAVEVSEWELPDAELAAAYDLMARVAVVTRRPEASAYASKALGLGGANEKRLLVAMEAHYLDGHLEGVQVLAKRLAEVAEVGDGADVARYWMKVQEQVPT